MDLFTHNMDPELFRSTNELWNQLRLNAKWSVGTVTEIIQQRPFQTKEEWQQFYYESGQERLRKIKTLSEADQQLLLKRSSPRELTDELRVLNTHYGRTLEELDQKAQILYEAASKLNDRISLELCQEAVRYRVIGETWNGVVVREQRTIDALKKEVQSWGLNQCDWLKTPGDFDYRYEVDYEIFIKGKRRIGLQIKPDSYRGITPYLEEAKRINLYKNQQYFKEYRVPVLYVYANSKGRISNLEEVREVLKQLLY